MQEDQYHISTIVSVYVEKKILEKNGEHYYSEVATASCPVVESVLTTIDLERLADDSVEQEVSALAQSLSCTLLTKWGVTSCKEVADGQLSLPLSTGNMVT